MSDILSVIKWKVKNVLNKKIILRKHENNNDSYMTTYILDDVVDNQKKRAMIVIFPGGGYSYCTKREGEPIACEFNSMGCNAVVVNYATKTPYPQSLIDASDAIVYIREHAEEWNTDPNKIFVCGFSAGAHLAGSIGIMSQKEDAIKRSDNMNKVNGMILCYPVISSGKFAHRGSFDNIGATNAELLKKTSLELQVDANTSPAFIWHTFADDVVPMENSLLLAEAMRKYNIPFELHIYPDGVHGLSMASGITSYNDDIFIVPHVQSWMPLAKEWLNKFI